MKTVQHRPIRAAIRTLVFAGMFAAGSIATAAPALAAWDSIAVDDDMSTNGGDAGYGVASGDSKAEAEAGALKNCKSQGNTGCKVEVSYKDQCGAYASSRKHAGQGVGASKADASHKALAVCGDGACKVVVADCVGAD